MIAYYKELSKLNIGVLSKCVYSIATKTKGEWLGMFDEVFDNKHNLTFKYGEVKDYYDLPPKTIFEKTLSASSRKKLDDLVSKFIELHKEG